MDFSCNVSKIISALKLQTCYKVFKQYGSCRTLSFLKFITFKSTKKDQNLFIFLILLDFGIQLVDQEAMRYNRDELFLQFFIILYGILK